MMDKKPLYAVLVGNTVIASDYDTKLYASLPVQDKYMVKQRVRDSSGPILRRITLVLKSSNDRLADSYIDIVSVM